MNYWFRPKQFWKHFAAYYPTSWQGWLMSVVLLGAFVLIFRAVDQTSHSGSDTLMGVTPYAIIIALIFDLLCFKKGEYPSWWKQRN